MRFDPLGDSSTFPADPARLQTYGDEVAATGALIEQQLVLLRRLASGDSWVADSADASATRPRSSRVRSRGPAAATSSPARS